MLLTTRKEAAKAADGEAKDAGRGRGGRIHKANAS